MTDGELLYATFCMAQDHVAGRPQLHVTWAGFSPYDQAVWAETVQRLLLQGFWSSGAGQSKPVPERNWKAELQKFGRHLPNCPTSGICICGFEKVEEELGL